MNIYQPVISGSLTVTGSTTFFGNITINSGSLTMTSGSLSGTASLASNALLLQGTGSVGFATTASLLEVSSSQQQISSSLLQVSASYISLSASYNTFSGSASTRITANSSSIQQVSSSQQQISASLLNVVANYATTGSNSFRANQSITGSLVVSSTITAQTLVVQTVTSSIVYSSGSNLFGSALGDRQTFTGSLNITGSGPHAIFGNVGIGVISPASKLEINGFGTPNSIMTQPIIAAYATNGFNLGSDGTNALIGVTNSGTDMVFLKRGGGEYSEAMRLTSGGNIGLGITSSAWNGIYRVFQIDAGSISSSPSYNNISVGSNVFYNVGNSPRYIVSDYATLYGQDDGIHAWYTAPSGTAGAAMTFTQSMTIANTGQVFIGTTSALFNTLVNINYNQSTYEGIAISTDKVYNGSPQPNLIFGGKYNSSGDYRQHATIQSYKDNATDGDSAASLVFSTNGNSASVTERMRISSAGLKFQNGATSLNYYEEGTFAPTNLNQNFDAVTVIYGRYVRIGNQVTINCRWNVDANTTGMKYLVFDLPFAFYNNANINFTGHVSNYNDGASAASSNVGTSVRNTAGSTTQQYIQAYYTSTGTAVTLLFSMTYQTF